MIVEPVLAHYRVALFEKLAGIRDIDVSVCASRTFPGAPDSVIDPPPWADLNHECLGLMGGRLQWQRGLRLPRAFGRGDVLVVDNNPRILSNFPLVSRAFASGAGVVLWGHGWSPTSTPSRARIRYWLMNRADVLMVYTEKEVRDLREQRHWSPHIFATNNALDQRPIASAAAVQTSESLLRFRRDHGLANKRIILFCGRLRRYPSTGLDVAIKSLIHLDQQFQLVIIGRGDAEQELRDLSRALGVSDRILWIGELYGEPQLAPWFLNAECFVYPGSIGLSVLHAFGYGVPVITHDQRRLHNPEIDALIDGENGLLFPLGDPQALARQINFLASDSQRRARMGRAAQTTVKSMFTIDGMAARFEAAVRLASTIARKRRGV